MSAKHRIAWLLVIVLTLVPLHTALANPAPKLSMEFAFTQAFPGSQVTITSGIMYECDQSDCSDAAPLREDGVQCFECEEATGCYSAAYRYSDYHHIEIQFSDGKTRRSNIFPTAGFNSKYKVTVRSDDLLVEALLGMYSLNLDRIVDAIYAYLMGRPGRVLATLLLAIVIEGAIVTIYALWRRRSLARLLLSTILANLVTQPLIWIVLSLLLGHYLPILFTAELSIWLIESAILRFFPGNRLSWKEALLLSLAMNLVSFGIGWFLPV